MTSCPRINDTAIECQYGCCGIASNQECCNYTLSETTLIIVCVVGGVLVVVVVIALIVCITSKNKNRVTRIHPRHRPNLYDEEPRRRPQLFPKPPPYSELPPQYDTLQTATVDNLDYTAYPGSTDISRNEHFHSNRRSRRGRTSGSPTFISRIAQSMSDRDAPPSYSSVIQQQTHARNNDQRSRSPLPGTSAENNAAGQESNLRTVVSIATLRNDLNRPGSPHPSLASGRISTSMTRNADGLHRSASERTTYHMFESPAQIPSSVNRRSTMNRGIGSVSPVTIREITVHNEIARERTTQQVEVATKTRIPRPLARKPSENSVLQRADGASLSHQVHEEASQAANANRESALSRISSASNQHVVQSNRQNINPPKPSSNIPPEQCPSELGQWPTTPVGLSSSAEARSATRRAALQQLHERRKQRNAS